MIKEIFDRYVGTSLSIDDYFFEEFIESEFLEYGFDHSLSFVRFDGDFGSDCRLVLSKIMMDKLATGKSKLSILRMGPAVSANNVLVVVGDFDGAVTALVGSSGAVFIGNCGQLNLDLRIGHGSRVVVGDKTTSNGARIVAINSLIAFKKDVMMSDEVLIQGFDQHGIVDLNTMEIVNTEKKNVVVGSHVWIGRRTVIMPGVNIQDGSIVGTGSVVTSDVGMCTAVAGVPARVLRENVSWCRPWTHIDAESQGFFASIV